MIREEINKFIKDKTGEKIENSTGRFGDFCLTPGVLNKIAGKENSTPVDIARKTAEELKTTFPEKIEKAEFEAGYLNIYLSKSAYLAELEEINKDIGAYLKDPENADKTIVFDYSSPNIAKPFSVGNLRSTIIGQANYNIHKALGFKTVGINHLGDWGTQFGKLIVAIKKWGSESEIAKNPIEKLNELYVKFHGEAEKDKLLDDEAREWFKKLEDGNEEAREIWQKCINWSMGEFERIYKILGIEIDETTGESFYIDKQKAVIAELKEKNHLKESEGAQIVELENLPPVLIQKKDGATLYMTRDLAAIKYRIEKHHPMEIIYHVGNDQSLHFQQLTAVVDKLKWNVKITHASHGMIRLPDGKMSTRRGRTILLDDLIDEAKSRALKIIEEKNPDLKNKEDVAQKIGISALKYADLVQNRKTDIVFSFDKAISLQGNSAPYIQYSYARVRSLIRKFKEKFPEETPIGSLDDSGVNLAKAVLKVERALRLSAQNSTPNILCEILFELVEEFNKFYEKERIIVEDKSKAQKNIFLVEIANLVLSKIFDILGLAKLEEI